MKFATFNSKIFFLIIAALTFSKETFASCVWNPSAVSLKTSTANLGSTIVQRDTPIGSTLMTTFVSSGYGSSTIFATCYPGDTATWILVGATPVSGYTNTYNTNVAGVGIKIQAGTSQFYYGTSTNPSSVYVEDATPLRVWAWSGWGTGYTISLIKTGATGSGDIGASQSKFTLANLGELLRLNITGGQITTVACSINTTNITVPLDDVLPANLTSISTTAKPKTFNVGLNCAAGARVNMIMTGTQNRDTSASGVLDLTGAGNADVATGVGIQILYNGTPVTLGNNMVLKTSAGGQESFPFTAQYYQTRSTVTAGSANSTATLNLTYQ